MATISNRSAYCLAMKWYPEMYQMRLDHDIPRLSELQHKKFTRIKVKGRTTISARKSCMALVIHTINSYNSIWRYATVDSTASGLIHSPYSDESGHPKVIGRTKRTGIRLPCISKLIWNDFKRSSYPQLADFFKIESDGTENMPTSSYI